MPAYEQEPSSSDDSDDFEEDQEDCRKQNDLLVPFVPLHKALGEVFCDKPRLLILLSLVVLTVCGMLFLPADSFKATYKGGSNKGIGNVAGFSACKHYCEKTYLDPTGFGKQSIGGEGICGVNGSEVKFCLFKSEHPTTCTKTKEDFITEEMMVEYGHSTKCSFKYVVPSWQPYFVIGGLAIAITLIIQGLAPEVALLGANAIFCAAGILSKKEAAAGFASSSVIALALLLPIAAAIEETGLLDRVVSVLLGQPTNTLIALVRMMIPVAFLSAALSNTAIVAMLVPVVVSWSRRLGCHAGKLMMPLSFAAQLGGSMTLIGSSHVLVARESVSDVYDVQFFSTTPAAFMLLIVTTVVILFLAPTPLLRHSAEAECCEDDDAEALEVGDSTGTSAQRADLLYNTIFVVQLLGALDGAEGDSVACTLMKLPGVKSVKGEDGELKGKLSGGQRIRCMATDQGVVSLRQVRGIEPESQPQLSLLGANRKERSLYACAVAKPELLPCNEPAKLRQEFGCALLASRRPGSSEIPWAPGQEPDIRASDVLLLEADNRYLNSQSERWFSTFSVVCQVKNSSPPRNGYTIDSVRAAIVCVGMLMLIALVAAEVADLSWGCGIFLLILLAIRAITLKELYGSIKVSVIFTIVGAFGLSTAMQKTGVANFIADTMLAVFAPMGTIGLCAAVYIVSVFLSMWISNSATVAIVGNLIGSMVTQLASEGEENIEAITAAFVWILICGAGSCFTTPLGYQTNMMVMPDGKYTFADFMVFGGPITLAHGVACIFLVPQIAKIWH